MQEEIKEIKEVEEVKGIENGNHSIMKNIAKLINCELFDSIAIDYVRRKRLLKQIAWQRFVKTCQEESFAEGNLLDESNDSEYQYVFGEIAHNLYEDIYGTFEWAH